MHIYDYLFAGVIIIALLLGSTVMMTTLSVPTINAADKDLLKITTEKIMTQILLDPGYPYNWGHDNTSAQNLKVFGLAKYGETSRQAYELDPDKVQRINKDLDGSGTNFVSADTVAGLLNLNNIYGSLDYGFTLEFSEKLQVNISNMGNGAYSLSVLSDYASPIMGATVSATLYFLEAGLIHSVGPFNNRTSFDGTCTLNYNESANNSYSKVLAVAVDYYGIQAKKLFNVNNSISASLFGNYVLPYPVGSYPIANGSDCREIVLFQNTSGIETRDFKISYSVSSDIFALNSAPDPSAVGVLAISQNQLIFAQRDFSKISYRTIPAIQSAASSYSLERTVLIGGTTFTATLYFWRMSS